MGHQSKYAKGVVIVQERSRDPSVMSYGSSASRSTYGSTSSSSPSSSDVSMTDTNSMTSYGWSRFRDPNASKSRSQTTPRQHGELTVRPEGNYVDVKTNPGPKVDVVIIDQKRPNPAHGEPTPGYHASSRYRNEYRHASQA